MKLVSPKSQIIVVGERGLGVLKLMSAPRVCERVSLML